MLTIGTSDNVINVYYTKRTDLSYTVNFLEKETNKVLHKAVTKDNQTFETVINSKDEVIEIDGYNFDSVNPEKLTIKTSGNVINVYYTKRTDLSYTVNFLEKETNKVLHKAVTKDNQTFETVINSKDEVIEIDGYNFDSVNPEKLTIKTSGNVINVYYTKRNDLSYTVNFLEKETNKVLHKAVTKDNQTFEDVINSKDEAVEIEGYKLDSVNPEKLTIKTSGNIINVYYEAVYGTIKVIYTDPDGNEIKEPEIIEGQVGTEYEIKPEKINKYELVETKGETKGKYTDEEQVITFVYERIPQTGLFQEESNNNFLTVIISFITLIGLIVFKKKVYNM